MTFCETVNVIQFERQTSPPLCRESFTSDRRLKEASEFTFKSFLSNAMHKVNSHTPQPLPFSDSDRHTRNGTLLMVAFTIFLISQTRRLRSCLVLTYFSVNRRVDIVRKHSRDFLIRYFGHRCFFCLYVGFNILVGLTNGIIMV